MNTEIKIPYSYKDMDYIKYISDDVIPLLKRNDIQKYLRQNNLDAIYSILNKEHEDYDDKRIIGYFTMFLYSLGINIFDYLDYVPDYCFSFSCLSDIEIPDNVREIGEGSFSGTELIHITIPGRIKTIPYFCVSDMYSLESITLEDGVEIIGDMAFSYLQEIEINFPSSIKSISDDAFYLTDRVQADCSESRYAFDYCSSNKESDYFII